MLKRFIPKQYVPTVFDISIQGLKDAGIHYIITDLDNTLVAWDQANATEELEAWFTHLRKEGFTIAIVSNNNKKRVKAFAEPLNIPFIYRAKKPLTGGFDQALKLLNGKKEEAVVIGDQLMTDILGGNRGGYNTVLVVPVKPSDSIFTKFNRIMERRVFSAMKRKGLIEWDQIDSRKR